MANAVTSGAPVLKRVTSPMRSAASTDEANRLYGVMNNRLNRRYLAGDEYTIADMISYP